VTWTSSATGVATISNSGLATGVVPGSTTVRAVSGSISGSATLTVTAPALVSIAVTPANPSVAAGLSQQFTATGSYTDNSTKDVTGSAAWSSSASGVATINSAGLATGVAPGVTTIAASLGSTIGSTTLTIRQFTLTGSMASARYGHTATLLNN